MYLTLLKIQTDTDLIAQAKSRIVPIQQVNAVGDEAITDVVHTEATAVLEITRCVIRLDRNRYLKLVRDAIAKAPEPLGKIGLRMLKADIREEVMANTAPTFKTAYLVLHRVDDSTYLVGGNGNNSSSILSVFMHPLSAAIEDSAIPVLPQWAEQLVYDSVIEGKQHTNSIAGHTIRPNGYAEFSNPTLHRTITLEDFTLGDIAAHELVNSKLTAAGFEFNNDFSLLVRHDSRAVGIEFNSGERFTLASLFTAVDDVNMYTLQKCLSILYRFYFS